MIGTIAIADMGRNDDHTIFGIVIGSIHDEGFRGRLYVVKIGLTRSRLTGWFILLGDIVGSGSRIRYLDKTLLDAT